MSRKVYRIQVERHDGVWLTISGKYGEAWEAEKAAKARCVWYRIVTGSGQVALQGPTR